MTLLIAMPGRDHRALQQHLQQLDPALRIAVWPQCDDVGEVDFAVLWNQPREVLAKLPGLTVAHSYGAGVEHILSDPGLSQKTRVARVCGSSLNASMADYLLMQLRKHALHEPADTAVGLLGFGQLGQAVAQQLVTAGYQMMAYARASRTHPGVRVFHGDRLCEMVSQSDFLICLLPLTAATQNILNVRMFAQCKPQSWIINVGRGAHLVENDLIYAIDEGPLRGATLDVTCQEPVPESHPFQQRSDIELTGHTASLTDPAEAARLIYRNYQHMLNDEPLEFCVDRQQGY